MFWNTVSIDNVQKLEKIYNSLLFYNLKTIINFKINVT